MAINLEINSTTNGHLILVTYDSYYKLFISVQRSIKGNLLTFIMCLIIICHKT